MMKSKYIFFYAIFYMAVIAHTSSNIYGTNENINGDAYEMLKIKGYQKTAILIVGYGLSEGYLKSIFGAQYDYLNEHSEQMEEDGFFPSEPKDYKEVILSHQLPFFKSFFGGTLTASQLTGFKNAHAKSKINVISHRDFDEMVTLVCEKFGKDHPWIASIFTPKNILEKFRPFVVINQPSN